MSPGKCGTYKIRYDITDMIWYRQDMILQARNDITGMIWYNTDKTWYVRGSLIGVLCYIPYWPEGRLFDLIIHMHLTLMILCVKCLMSRHDVIWYERSSQIGVLCYIMPMPGGRLHPLDYSNHGITYSRMRHWLDAWLNWKSTELGLYGKLRVKCEYYVYLRICI